MVVLVTGAAGFVAANLVRALIKKGDKVHVFQKASSDLWRLKEIKKNLVFHQEELKDRQKTKRLLKRIRPRIIYHLAAHGSYPDQTDLEKMVATNILGTLNLLLASDEIPYQCLVNTGSSSEYGVKSKPMQEDEVCAPTSFYAATKLSATTLCQVFAQIYQKPIVTFRPFSVYGPYEKETRFIPTIIRCLLDDQPIKLTPLTVRHDFIYVEDLVKAYLQAPKKINRLAGKILNIGTGQEWSNDQVVQLLFKVTGKQVPIEKGAYLPKSGDAPHWRADISQAKKLLGWQPKISLGQGLKKTFNWFKKQNANPGSN